MKFSSKASKASKANKATAKDSTAVGPSVDCSAASGDILKQFGSVAETALINWLQGIVTVSNIQKCLGASGEKLEDDLKRKKGTCPPSTLPPNNSKITVPGKSPALADQYVQYPSNFDNNKTFAAPSPTGPTNWNLANKTSVVGRWQPPAQAV